MNEARWSTYPTGDSLFLSYWTFTHGVAQYYTYPSFSLGNFLSLSVSDMKFVKNVDCLTNVCLRRSKSTGANSRQKWQFSLGSRGKKGSRSFRTISAAVELKVRCSTS